MDKSQLVSAGAKVGVIMTAFKFIVAAIVLVVVTTVFVYLAMSYMTKKKHMSEKQKMQGYNKRFRFYYDFVLTRSSFRKVHEQIANLAVYSFMECRVVTVKFFEKSMIIGIVLFVVGFIGLGDLVSGVVLLMFAFVLMNSLIAKRIDDVNFQSLKDMSSLILSIRECYTRVRNVPDAVNDATCPKLLQRHINKIYLICTATDSKERLEAFYKECPNRIMRTLATTCYIRSDAGENEEPGAPSPFKQALGLIKDEVDMEVRRQINQRIMFNTLDKLPFVPLFLYPPIVIFYTKMISATASVFDSSTGYIIKLAIVLGCFISYYILSTINNASVARSDDRMLSLVKALYHTSVQKFAKTLVTKKYKVRVAIEKKINGCLSMKTLEYFYLEKLVYAVSLFFLSMVFSVLIMISARSAVHNSLNAATMSVNLTYTSEQKAKTLEYDHTVLAMESLPADEEMTETFVKIFPKETTVFVDAQVERLKAKYKNYHALKFRWFLAFLYIAVYFVGWNLPNVLLNLRAKLVQSEAELDVLQLQTVIAILMDTPLDTLSVIYWLAKSSDIHKDILTYCYHEYVRDPMYALANLKKKSAIAEFSSMCDKLTTTVFQVTLAEAFEDLIAERNNTMKVREVVQLDALKSKRNIAGPIATMPMMVWMVAAFILPIVIVAARSAVAMMGQLNM